MEEITSDLKHLIKLQRQRPAFARTISWEFSQTEEGQKKTKSKKKTRGPKNDGNKAEGGEIGDEIEADIASEIASASREHRLSTIESVGDSGSSDESEYFSALEDEVDESVTTDDTFDTLDSLGDCNVDNVEGIDDDMADNSHSLDSSQDAGDQPSGRRRRPSKKQKRKRNREFKVTFVNEIMSLGNIFDVSEDIDIAVAETTESESLSSVNRQVPTLVQLCMAVTSRKAQTKQKARLPVGMRRLVSGWNRKQSLLQKQLSWLQNHLLPICDNEDKFKTLCYFNKNKENGYEPVFLYPTRSVWNALPFPIYRHWNEDQIYTSGKASSFLLDACLNHVKQTESARWEYNNYCTYESIRCLCLLSALASAIDLMLPAFVLERSLCGRNVTEQVLFSAGFKTMVVRVKIALKARFPRVVDELFEKALPYVMWARGNVAMATEMFNNLIVKEKRVRHKAMYLSEIARMNCEYDETETAVKFYRLAADTSIAKPNSNEKDCEEVTEQTQILLASVHDSGVLTCDKARQSSSCWNSALNLPKQRLSTAVMAVESFLCYHAAHLADTCWQEEVLTKIRNAEKTHQYLKYHASMILALQGKETESRFKYKESINGSSISPGHHLLTILSKNKIRNAWHPLIDMVNNNKTPLKLLKVVWRRQLVPPKITSERPAEGQINSPDLNLHINDEGHVTGDIQNLLPPQRDISLDPYTGASIINHVPSLTSPWRKCDFDNEDYRINTFFMPTPQVIYSEESGTTLYMVKLSSDACTRYLTNKTPDEPFFLYWQNSSGQRAKINVQKVFLNKYKENVLSEVPLRTGWPEEKKTRVLEIMKMYLDNNLAFDMYELERKYNEIVAQERKDRKKKHVPKRSKKFFLRSARPVSIKLDDEPRTFGSSIILELKDHLSRKYILFVSTRDKKSFLDYKMISVSNDSLVKPSCLKSLSEQGEFCMMYEARHALGIFNQFGVKVESLKDVKCQDWTPSPCVIGPYVYMITKDKVSVWKHLIGVEEPEDEEERQTERASNTSWAFSKYWCLKPDTETKQVMKMKVVGHHHGDAGSFLMIHTSVGLCFMNPESFDLLTITLETKNPSPYPLSEDGNVLLCNVGKVKLLAEKNYMVDIKQITKIAVAIENNILVFEIETSTTQQGMQAAATQMKLITSVSLPGFAVEACFVGKEVGLLVSTTMYVKESGYYRQNVFYFKPGGHCYGMLLCLGRGPRSFLPLYLNGKEGGGEAGWYVYMRDGHNGIISVKLHDKTL